MTYDLPDCIQIEADGPVRIVRLNRPEQLNATNHRLHQGLAELFPQVDADAEAQVVVLTGKGRAFSAGGDFGYIDELVRDPVRRKESLTHGKQIVTGMAASRAARVTAKSAVLRPLPGPPTTTRCPSRGGDHARIS